MTIYHAYEVVTDSSCSMYASTNEVIRDQALIGKLGFYRKTNIEVGTLATGTVKASNLEEAFEKIRAGYWQKN